MRSTCSGEAVKCAFPSSVAKVRESRGPLGSWKPPPGSSRRRSKSSKPGITREM